MEGHGQTRDAPFRVEVAHHEGWQRIAVSGDVDIATYGQVDRAVSEVCDSEAKLIELDLTGVTFMDSVGLRGLLIAVDRCGEHHAQLRIRSNESLDRLLELTGLLGVLPLHRV